MKPFISAWCLVMFWELFGWVSGASTMIRIQELKESGIELTPGLFGSEFFRDFLIAGLIAALICIPYWKTQKNS